MTFPRRRIGKNPQLTGRTKPCCWQFSVATSKPVKNRPLLVPRNHEGGAPAAFKRRKGQCDARLALGVNDGSNPPVALGKHRRAWEQ